MSARDKVILWVINCRFTLPRKALTFLNTVPFPFTTMEGFVGGIIVWLVPLCANVLNCPPPKEDTIESFVMSRLFLTELSYSLQSSQEVRFLKPYPGTYSIKFDSTFLPPLGK